MHMQFVAHPNCQQHLTTIWYGAEMSFLQACSSWKKFALTFGAVLGLPLLCFTHILFPNSKASAYSLSYTYIHTHTHSLTT